MNAIFKRSLIFRAEDGKETIIRQSHELVEVPDWIRNTPTYLLNLSDRGIVEINPADHYKVSITKSEHEEYLRLKRSSVVPVQSPNEPLEITKIDHAGYLAMKNELADEKVKREAAEKKIQELTEQLASAPGADSQEADENSEEREEEDIDAAAPEGKKKSGKKNKQ